MRSEDTANHEYFSEAIEMMQHLTQLLSMNPVIKWFNHSVYVEPYPYSDADKLALRQAIGSYDEESEGALERAIEVYLEAGMLSPLRELSDVRVFQFLVQRLDGKVKARKLQRKHADMVCEVKKRLERNYSEKQACLNMKEH